MQLRRVVGSLFSSTHDQKHQFLSHTSLLDLRPAAGLEKDSSGHAIKTNPGADESAPGFVFIHLLGIALSGTRHIASVPL